MGLQSRVQTSNAAAVLLLAGTVTATIMRDFKGIKGATPTNTPTAVPLARAVGVPCICLKARSRDRMESFTSAADNSGNGFAQVIPMRRQDNRFNPQRQGKGQQGLGRAVD